MRTVKERLLPYVGLCKNIGPQFMIEPELLLAIILKESNGIVGALRFEPNFQWVYKQKENSLNLGITEKTEETAQKFSYGLTQIMLATARWLGFTGYPYELYEPTGNIMWCAKYLSLLHQRHASLNDIIASYNAGSPRKDQFGKYLNQDYVDNVIKYMNYIKTSGLLNEPAIIG